VFRAQPIAISAAQSVFTDRFSRILAFDKRRRLGLFGGRNVAHRQNFGELTEDRALIAHCREVLGQDGEGLSDDEIDDLRRSAEEMARVLIGVFLAKSKQGEEPLRPDEP
jgi:hypothetical protein